MTAQDALDFFKHFGLRWVELRTIPGSNRDYALASEAEVKGAAATFSANGLRISFLHTSVLKSPKDDLQKACAAANILGCDKVGVLTGQRAVDEIGSLAEIAGSYQVHLAISNIAAPQEIADIMQAIPSKWVGYNWNPTSVDGYAVLPKDRMLNVQFGPVKLDWSRIVKSLEKDGYKYQLGLTASPDTADDAMKDMLRIVD